ncbi:MAG: DUF4382 domain-containing protein [Chloroflexi bacterium]|nr:DUF4382 domain-containing protein [Chloroflexota bacterium]
MRLLPLPPGPHPHQVHRPGRLANFRFLVSDDVNAIDQFQSLEVSISRIGLLRGGESGKWIEVPPQTPTVDLTQLQGENAEEIWSGTLPEGQYTKVFVYIDSVQGILTAEPGQTIDVKLPSNKLQLSKSFEIAAGTPLSFVYDLTVIATGNPKSGIKYILKPQIGESGGAQSFKEVEPTKAIERLKTKGELAFQLEGDVVPGGAATVTLTYQGIPLPNVLVELDDDLGENLGSTDAQGQLVIQIPIDADEVELETELEGKLKIEYTEGVPSTPEVSGELTLQLDAEAAPGSAVTLTVTHQGTVLPNVPFKLNDEQIGVSDALGQLAFQIPLGVLEVELEAELEGKFKLKFREEKIEPQEFQGTITTLTEGAELNSPWTITIPGIEDPVTVYVLEVEDGTPQVGSEVKVKGVFIEGAILDAETKVEASEEDGDEVEGSEGQNVKVTQTENPYVFDPDTYEFELGKTYTLVFEPTGEFHTFNVDELGIEIFVNAGEEVKQEITPSVPGTFKLYCIPHESLGMVGTVTVS